MARRHAGTAALVALTLAGLGALRIVARRRSLEPDLERVRPDLRTPLIMMGRGRDGEPQLLRESRIPEALSWALSVVVPSGLGTRRTVNTPQARVPVWLYETPERCESGPTGALVWFHGGGLVAGSPGQDHGLCSRIARELGCLVVSVDYRLAPRHPYPAAIDDCTAVLRWVHAAAADLHVDTRRVAVGGASAGGGLAAATAQRALDENLPLAFQLLIYPMLDDHTGADGNPVPGQGMFIWTARNNAESWQAYLSHRPGQPEERPWAVPARRRSLAGLARAWIGVGELDLFLDECRDYARRLKEAGVAVQVRVEPGMYHGADLFRWSAAMRDFRDEAVAALGAAINPSRETTA